MKYRICVAAAGCLPDSDIYPYVVDDFNELVEALKRELDDLDDELFHKRLFEAIRTLQRENGYTAVPLSGTYTLTVEPVGVVEVDERRATVERFGRERMSDDEVHDRWADDGGRIEIDEDARCDYYGSKG